MSGRFWSGRRSRRSCLRGCPGEVHQRARLSGEELASLPFLIVGINGWNRLVVGFQTAPGSKDALFGLDKAGLK